DAGAEQPEVVVAKLTAHVGVRHPVRIAEHDQTRHLSVRPGLSNRDSDGWQLLGGGLLAELSILPHLPRFRVWALLEHRLQPGEPAMSSKEERFGSEVCSTVRLSLSNLQRTRSAEADHAAHCRGSNGRGVAPIHDDLDQGRDTHEGIEDAV